jgi:hypothetical protein
LAAVAVVFLLLLFSGNVYAQIAGSVLWSLLSGYVFSGGHKGKAERSLSWSQWYRSARGIRLVIIGIVLALITVAPVTIVSMGVFDSFADLVARESALVLGVMAGWFGRGGVHYFYDRFAGRAERRKKLMVRLGLLPKEGPIENAWTEVRKMVGAERFKIFENLNVANRLDELSSGSRINSETAVADVLLDLAKEVRDQDLSPGQAAGYLGKHPVFSDLMPVEGLLENAAARMEWEASPVKGRAPPLTYAMILLLLNRKIKEDGEQRIHETNLSRLRFQNQGNAVQFY